MCGSGGASHNFKSPVGGTRVNIVRGWGRKRVLLCRKICWEFRQHLQEKIPEIGNFDVSEWEFLGVVRNITELWVPLNEWPFSSVGLLRTQLFQQIY